MYFEIISESLQHNYTRSSEIFSTMWSHILQQMTTNFNTERHIIVSNFGSFVVPELFQTMLVLNLC